MTLGDIHQKFLVLKQEKEQGSELMRKVNQFFAPSDEIYSGSQSVGMSLSQKGELLDTTVSEVIEEYVSNVLGLYFNTEVAWFKIEYPGIELDSPDQQILSNRAKMLYRLISKSNYYSVCPQHEWDVLVHGHGLMVIEKDSDDFARCYTKEPVDLYFKQSEDYRIIEMYWSSRMDSAALSFKYPDITVNDISAATDGTALSDYTVVYCVVPNTEMYRAGLEDDQIKKVKGKGKWLYRAVLIRSDITDEAAQSVGMDPKKRNYSYVELDLKAIADNRFVGARNIPSRQHPYGNGMGKKMLIRARILNKLARDIIKSSGQTANPTRIVDPIIKKQLANPNELEEGALISRPNNYSRGSAQPVETLDVRSDISGIMAVIQHQEEKVSSQLPTTSQAYKVARQSVQEIQQRLREQEKRLGPIRSHYLKEAVSKHLRRFWKIAKEQGHFNGDGYQFSDKSLEKKVPKFTFDALMLQSHRLTRALLFNQALAQSQTLFAIKPTSVHYLDGDKAMKMVFDGNSCSDLLRPYEEVEKEREEIQKNQQAQEQQQQQQVEATSVKDSTSALKNMVDAIGGGGTIGGGPNA